jgi:hypothetical protein
MKSRTCPICKEPFLTRKSARSWITVHGVDYHPECYRVEEKRLKRKRILTYANPP